MQFLKRIPWLVLLALAVLGFALYKAGFWTAAQEKAEDVEAVVEYIQHGPKKYPRNFSLEWDEEVKLHDGRMIVVRIKRNFRRQSETVEWDRIWYQGTKISFDAGEPWGRYERYFQGYQVKGIDHYEGKWYFSLNRASPGAGPNPRIVQQIYPVLILDETGEKPAENWKDIPAFAIYNVLPKIPDVKGIAKFNGKKVGWFEKLDYWYFHSPNGVNANKLLINPEQPKIKSTGEIK